MGANPFWEERIELGENFCPLLVKATAITLRQSTKIELRWHDFGKSGDVRSVLMEVWFPRREYAVGQAPQGHSNDRICRH